MRPELALPEVSCEKFQVGRIGGEHMQPACAKITLRRQMPMLGYVEGDQVTPVHESVVKLAE